MFFQGFRGGAQGLLLLFLIQQQVHLQQPEVLCLAGIGFAQPANAVNGVLKLSILGQQRAGAGQGREVVIALFHALVIANGLLGIACLVFNAAQVVVGFAGMVALFGQLCQFLPGQVGLPIFKSDQCMRESQARRVRVPLYEAIEFILGSL